MRSSRYRKLMEGSKKIQKGQKAVFEITVSQGNLCQCQMQSWREEIFRQLQNGPSMSELLNQFRQWVQLPPEILGKKSSEVAISKSQLYCIKNINQEDFETFKQIFQKYVEFKKKQINCSLVPIYGVINLISVYQKKNKWTDSFIIMPNLKPKTGVVYDIKGHIDNRLVLDQDFKDFSFGKDQNFIKGQYKQILLKTELALREKLLENIRINLQFLKVCKLIDYSLLLIFSQIQDEENKCNQMFVLDNKYILKWEFIDYFQTYNQRKKLQNKISSVDPQIYANRLFNFAKLTILGKEEPS